MPIHTVKSSIFLCLQKFDETEDTETKVYNKSRYNYLKHFHYNHDFQILSV